ncbi:MAG: type pilus assembly protein PilC [Solirubrobacteraceae bacterium]|jgi:type IV pilus assembly protein PilC|nr:type pilus assembly protein PilC [Solirubrobacteraceae bacterium]
MSTYLFKAMDMAGAPMRGNVEAETKQAVSDQLKARGLIVLEIAEKHASRELNLSMFERIKLGDLAVMSRQLATMVSSGMTILRALFVLEEQTENKKLLATLVAVRKDVEAGLALSQALARHPKVFTPLFVSMVRAGEIGGVLEDSLIRIADQLEKEDALNRQVRSAMVYPTVVVVVALIVMIALVVFVVPVFAGVLKEFSHTAAGAQLPFITQVTVDTSHAIISSWYFFILGIGLTVFAFIKWKKSVRGRMQWDRLRLRIPFKIGDIVQKIAIARWARTLSALTTAGVPLLEALDITGKSAGNAVVTAAMGDVITSVKGGGTIAAPLKEAPVFPTMVGHMVGVGESTGELDTMLTKIAEFYEERVSAAVKALTSILEPVMIVFIGGMVGFIVIAMYLPLFKVYNQVG